MTDPELTAALRELETWTRAELTKQWRWLYKSGSPRYADPKFLKSAIAYALQERSHGGLSAAKRRQLTAIANGAAHAPSPQSIKMKPGMRLLRHWHGTTYEVVVTDKGLFWSGKTYRSVSAVAFAITGAKWNGRLFFGLAKRRRPSND